MSCREEPEVIPGSCQVVPNNFLKVPSQTYSIKLNPEAREFIPKSRSFCNLRHLEMRQPLAWFPMLEEINEEIEESHVATTKVENIVGNAMAEFSIQRHLKTRQDWFPVLEDIPEEDEEPVKSISLMNYLINKRAEFSNKQHLEMRQPLAWFPLLEEIQEEMEGPAKMVSFINSLIIEEASFSNEHHLEMRQPLVWFPLLEEIQEEIEQIEQTVSSKSMKVSSSVGNANAEVNIQRFLKTRQDWFPVLEDIPADAEHPAIQICACDNLILEEIAHSSQQYLQMWQPLAWFPLLEEIREDFRESRSAKSDDRAPRKWNPLSVLILEDGEISKQLAHMAASWIRRCKSHRQSFLKEHLNVPIMQRQCVNDAIKILGSRHRSLELLSPERSNYSKLKCLKRDRRYRGLQAIAYRHSLTKTSNSTM